MSTSVTYNAITYTIPAVGDSNWGNNVSNYLVALATGSLTKAGGTFTLAADANFGPTFGLISKYFTSVTASPASTGQVRLANTDSVSFRNSGNSADIALKPDADGILQYGGVDLVNLSASQTLTNKTLTTPTINGATLSGTLAGAVTMSGAVTFSAAGTAVTVTNNVLVSGTASSAAFISTSANPASAGAIRLASTDAVEWRNNGNSADVALAKNTSDQLSWAGTAFLSSSAVLLAAAFPALTGDITTSAGALATTLATVNANVGSFGSSTAIPTFTVNGKGLITAASTSAVVAPAGTLTGTTLASNVVTSSLTTVGTIGTGVWQGTAIGAQYGGTGIDTHSATGVPTISAGTWSTSAQLPAGNFPALTGDITTSAGALATTLATVNSNTGSFGSSTAIPNFTVNGKGLITAAGTSAVIAPAGTLTGTTLASNVVTSSLTTVGTIGTGTWQGTTVAVGFGGTGVTSVTTAPAATAWAGWDANKNLSANNHLAGYATTATAAGTTTLTVSSAENQYFTGITTQTVVLPVATTLVNGQSWTIVNLSTGIVTVQTSGSNTVVAMAQNSQLVVTCSNTAGGTGTASWTWNYTAVAGTSLAGGGTVTSVTFTGDGTVLSSTPSSAVTSSGTVTASLKTQTANTSLYGPTSGSAAAPTFRAVTSADASGTTLSEACNLYNLALKYTIGSSNLTVNVTQRDGSTNPTADNPAIYSLRSTTATTGSYTHQALTAATSVVLLAHTPLGLTLSQSQYLYIYGATSGVILAAPALWDEQTLQAYVPESAALTSISNASPGVCTLTAHGLNNGDSITLTTSGSLPTGLVTDNPYYIVNAAANTFQLSATVGGTAINTSSAGSGTHTYHVNSNRLVCTAGTSGATGQAIRLLGRMQFSPGSAVAWAAPAEVSPPSAAPARRAPTVQKFSSGSGTYQTPANCLYIRVRMVGGGGAGGASGTGSFGAAVNGNSTTFGTMTAGGGSGILTVTGSPAGGAGGAASGLLGNGYSLTGTVGSPGNYQATGIGNLSGGVGGTSPFGGGAGGAGAGNGNAGVANTGGGGQGGGTGANNGSTAGGGGGAGAYIDTIISSPAANYSYTVGAATASCSAGTSGNGGGSGGSGFIIVEEYYT